MAASAPTHLGNSTQRKEPLPPAGVVFMISNDDEDPGCRSPETGVEVAVGCSQFQSVSVSCGWLQSVAVAVAVVERESIQALGIPDAAAFSSLYF